MGSPPLSPFSVLQAPSRFLLVFALEESVNDKFLRVCITVMAKT